MEGSCPMYTIHTAILINMGSCPMYNIQSHIDKYETSVLWTILIYKYIDKH